MRSCGRKQLRARGHGERIYALSAQKLGKFWDPHGREKRTDGHSTGWACGGQRDAQMDTLEGGQEAEAGATVLLLPALLPALEPTLPSQGSLPRAEGHCAVARRLGPMMDHGELTNTTASSSGSLDRGHS